VFFFDSACDICYNIRAAFLQECTFFFQQEKIDKLKYSNEDIDSFVHRKSSKKFKSKKKKDKKGSKKHKKKRKYSSSSSVNIKDFIIFNY